MAINEILLVLMFIAVCVAYSGNLCPEQIRSICECQSLPLSVRCANKSLNEYPDLSSVQNAIRRLDMSSNKLKTFPRSLNQFMNLEILDLSYNYIDSIPTTVIFPAQLRRLILSHNNITSWLQINPNTVLQSAINLHTLSLAGNAFRSFSANEERLLLISSSLETLDLTDCQITKITGMLVLSGMTNLEHLILNENPLYTLPDLKAEKLLSLEVSNCQLQTLQRTVFSHMPMLMYVNLSRNYRLRLSSGRGEKFVESKSLRRLDLSECYMNKVELEGFPNIRTVLLRGNSITELTNETFQHNVFIEILDISYNAIKRIDEMSFVWLKRLQSLDLTFNTIQEIKPDTFINNHQLTSINLSRNIIEHFCRIASKSLTFLNASWNEITSVDSQALDDLPELIELDLSNNFFSVLPPKLNSSLLQILDLSRCRLSIVDNDTFKGFPELNRLNLAGNRFTTTFRKEFFASNPFLNEVWLDDNPWRCECLQNGLHDFFRYLIESSPRIKDRLQLRCQTPEYAHDKLWEVFCYNDWYSGTRQMNSVEKMWTITMIVLIALTVIYCAISGVNRWLRYRRKAEEEAQRLENLETTRELMRHNQMVLEQESQLNAPDPRESYPPCYEDAIRLPRLDTSFASLKRAGVFGDDLNDSIKRAAKRSRCRSEEILSPRNANANRPRRHILAARIRRNQQRNDNFDLNMSASTNECSHPLESQGAVASTETETRSLASNESAFELINNLETTDGNSPYAKRRAKQSTEVVIPVASTSAALLKYQEDNSRDMREIVIIENHYRSRNSLSAVDNPQQLGVKASPSPSSPSSLSQSSISFSSCSSNSESTYSQLENHDSHSSRRSDI